VSGASGLRKHGHTSAGDGGTISLPSAAEDVTYDNSGSGLTATDVQAAIDELDGTVDGFGSAVDISDDGANVQGVNFEDQGSNPATPAAGHTIAYTKSDGLYVKDDAGAVTGPLGTGGGAVATDAIWDAKGDLAAGTGADTAAKLTVGSNDTILMADSGQSTGLKWVAAGTPVDQNYDDVAAVGTADTFARGDHVHGMPASGGVAEITDLPTAEMDDTLVLAPDGAGGVEFRAETGGSGNVATDAIWDAAGDLAVGTGANTAAKLTKGATGTVPTAGASTLAYAYPPGYEFDYVEFTSTVSPTATTEATANTVVTGSAVSYDGSTVVIIEFVCGDAGAPPGANNFMQLWLYDGSSSIGYMGLILNNVVTNTARMPIVLRHRLTPSNASHTYSIRGSVNTGTGQLNAGAGGGGTAMPGYIRITKG
jgi:hypothetical protein